jgi:transcriptional regulator with XRE-family HTH domain
MSKYNAATLVRFLRERIGLEREAMLMLSMLDDSSLRRIEDEKQHPKSETLDSLIESINLPVEGFVYSLLEDHSMEVIIMRDKLTQTLDLENVDAASSILQHLEKLPDFKTGVQRQFLLSKKARLWELQGKSANQILPLVIEGMKETFENFDVSALSDTVLVFEESELLHTKARVLAKAGKLFEAISLLEAMMICLKKLPSADREKERLYAPVLISLIKCLLQLNDYEKIPPLCDLGAEYSASRNIGLYNPEFELLKAKALRGLGHTIECKPHLQHAYFGYMLLGETGKANNVVAVSKNEFDIEFNLYGVDKLDFFIQARIPYNRGYSVECNSLGTMISALRKKANLSLSQLSRGICNKSTLYRIEKDEIQGSFFILEALMQRLGRDISLYNNFFLSKKDFTAMQLRDRIYLSLIMQKYPVASELLSELETSVAFKRYSVNRQFIETAKACLFEAKHNTQKSELHDMLISALKITCPCFNECDIEMYNFTYNEMFIINQIASYFINTEKNLRAINVYERLLKNIRSKYDDEFEKARLYAPTLFNCSTSLGRTGKRNEALNKIAEGEHFERIHGRLTILPELSFNKGFNKMMLVSKESSIPYFTLAYYGFSMFANHGKCGYLSITRKSVKRHLELVFD